MQGHVSSCADMTRQGLGLDAKGTDLILENVGNLVCPAEFDTGATKINDSKCSRGDDKPLKYPLMFEVSDVLLINKIDVMDYLTLTCLCIERVKLNQT